MAELDPVPIDPETGEEYEWRPARISDPRCHTTQEEEMEARRLARRKKLEPWMEAQGLRARGWTHMEIGRKLGVSPSTVSRWLKKHRRKKPRLFDGSPAKKVVDLGQSDKGKGARGLALSATPFAKGVGKTKGQIQSGVAPIPHRGQDDKVVPTRSRRYEDPPHRLMADEYAEPGKELSSQTKAQMLRKHERMTYAEIGDRLGVSASTARRLVKA